MPIVHEHAPNNNGRVTAGIPSLSPEKRHEITESGLSRAYQRTLQADYFKNEQNALEDDNGADVTEWEQVVGIPLTGARIISRLKKLNSSLWFEPSNADRSKTGIYHWRPDLKGGMEKIFICGMETEINPEFTLRVVDEQGQAKGIISGWRRVLMRLIRKGLITEPGAWSLFGPPSRDSENWARFTA